MPLRSALVASSAGDDAIPSIGRSGLSEEFILACGSHLAACIVNLIWLAFGFTIDYYQLMPCLCLFIGSLMARSNGSENAAV